MARPTSTPDEKLAAIVALADQLSAQLKDGRSARRLIGMAVQEIKDRMNGKEDF